MDRNGFSLVRLPGGIVRYGSRGRRRWTWFTGWESPDRPGIQIAHIGASGVHGYALRVTGHQWPINETGAAWLLTVPGARLSLVPVKGFPTIAECDAEVARIAAVRA
jgi:hypothetical protein